MLLIKKRQSQRVGVGVGWWWWGGGGGGVGGWGGGGVGGWGGGGGVGGWGGGGGGGHVGPMNLAIWDAMIFLQISQPQYKCLWGHISMALLFFFCTSPSIYEVAIFLALAAEVPRQQRSSTGVPTNTSRIQYQSLEEWWSGTALTFPICHWRVKNAAVKDNRYCTKLLLRRYKVSFGTNASKSMG